VERLEKDLLQPLSFPLQSSSTGSKPIETEKMENAGYQPDQADPQVDGMVEVDLNAQQMRQHSDSDSRGISDSQSHHSSYSESNSLSHSPDASDKSIPKLNGDETRRIRVSISKSKEEFEVASLVSALCCSVFGGALRSPGQ
jgi:hypothetical protein